MTLDSWLIKLRTALSPRLDSSRSPAVASATGRPRKAKIGILSFEAASLMSKLLLMWRSLSDVQVARLRRESIALPGVRKVVSDDDAFLLSLACAELVESLRFVEKSISTLAVRCTDPGLRYFGRRFEEFAASGRDDHRWSMSWKEMDDKARKMDHYVSVTIALYKEMEQLRETELALKRLNQFAGGSRDESHHQSAALLKMAAISNLQHNLFLHKQEIRHLKETSLWGRSFDMVALLLARSAFTVLSRLRHVFGHDVLPAPTALSSSLPRSLSVSSAVHPSCEMLSESLLGFSSGPLITTLPKFKKDHHFFDSTSAAILPPPGTLGGAALALQYSNIIVLIERMIQCPRPAIGADARDELYSLLPAAVRSSLRSRLRGVGRCAARDAGFAAEWRTALSMIMGWLAPLAHNTLRWQAERSFEQRRSGGVCSLGDQVLLLQTLYFADREKTEATIVELLVGLNYVWRYETEVGSARASSPMERGRH